MINTKQRVLILSTSAGSGHLAAATALEQVFGQMPNVEVQNQDALELTSKALRATYADAYLRLVKDHPWLVGWWYDLQNQPFKGDQVRLLWERLNAERLIRFIKDYAPQITVCTHFMPAGIIAQLMARQELDTTLAIVTTDFDFQGMWLSPMFHHYFVALEETKVHIQSLGIPPAHVTVSGIPVNPVLGIPVDREAALAAYKLDPHTPVLLFSVGAAGLASATTIVEQLRQVESNVQIVVVCGKNEQLRGEIEQLVAPQAERFRVLGYTTDMPNLMRVATLFIGKPGGLTSAECMAARLPMLIIEPIPGQEERNSDHLLEEGAAVRCNELTTVAYKVERLLREPARLEQMRANTARLARPDAAQHIVDTLLQRQEPAYQIGALERQQIMSAARGEVHLELPASDSAEQIWLYSEQTGVRLAQITGEQLQTLLTITDTTDLNSTIMIDATTIEELRAVGVEGALLDQLRFVAAGEPLELRWARTIGIEQET